MALKTDDRTKSFYNIPMIRISYTGLLLTIIFGALCMAVQDLSNWAGVIICLPVLVFTAIAVIKANAAADMIEWRVLDIEDNQALVISKYALDCQPYHTSDTDITWEDCTLRTWLNDTFFNSAFSMQHQELILTTSVSADKNPKYDTSSGGVTNDRVFLLSIEEMMKYFTSASSRECLGTAYCYAQGAYRGDNYMCDWWSRSLGNSQDCASGVSIDGLFDCRGADVVYVGIAVRPALWINLDF